MNNQGQSAAAKTIQPQQLFDLLNVKNMEEAHKVLATSMSLLAYMSPGDKLETSDMTFSKISVDLIHVKCNMDFNQIVDSLHQSRILRLPV